jgi:hypothetical protein
VGANLNLETGNLACFLLSEFASFEWFVVSPVSHDLSVFCALLVAIASAAADVAK